MPQPVLGIMALYWNNNKQLEERPYFKKIIAYGKKMGLDVFVFTPQDVHHVTKKIYALEYNTTDRNWKRTWRPFPPLIFDRCRYQPTKRFQQLRQFRAKYPHLTYLNRPLANKWIIFQALHKHANIRPYLPDTKLFTQSSDILQMLKQHPVIYVKPINGTGGRDILRIERLASGGGQLEGRDPMRRIIVPRKLSREQLVGKLSLRRKSGRYLVQQGIDLKLDNGRVHDYRLLIQKNGQGDWEVTGCAGRVGAPNSVTSNLHGGGKAIAMRQLLKEWFPSQARIDSIQTEAYRLGHDIVKSIEKEYGRLCELALDLAIERSGHIWLLEINPKPGREVFEEIGEQETYRKAITRPLEYALWLYKQKHASD